MSSGVRPPEGGAPLPARRILIVVDGRYPSTGGAEMQARLLARSFAAAGHQVRVLAPLLESGRARAETIDGVPVERIAYPRVRLLGAILLCLRFGAWLLAHRGSYDAIHVHMAKNLAATAGLLRPWLKVPLVVKISGAWEFDSGILDPGRRRRPATRLYNACIRRADCIQCVSGYTRGMVLEAGYPPARVRLFPNAVDLGRFSPAPEAGPSGPGSASIVLFVGRLVPVKGLAVLLEAWHRLGARRDARLVIAGDGPERDRLQAMARDLGIAGSVDFLGEVADVPQQLRRASIYVQPSHMEGLSNAVLEAMACGLPVVATRVSGSEDVIDDGVNGLLVAPGDAGDLSAALQRLLDDRERGRRMGRASRSIVERKYAVPVVLATLLGLYGAGEPAAVP